MRKHRIRRQKGALEQKVLLHAIQIHDIGRIYMLNRSYLLKGSRILRLRKGNVEGIHNSCILRSRYRLRFAHSKPFPENVHRCRKI